MDYSDLFNDLTSQLNQYNYSVSDEVVSEYVKYIAYVKNPHPLKVRNLCAVLEIPATIVDNTAAKKFFAKVRSSLLNKYGNAILWKELEMCFIVICEDQLYKELYNTGGKAAAEAQFSLNSMMGTSFINKKTKDTFNHSTWGIYFSGEHYKTVCQTVEQWCQSNGIEK